VQNVIACGSGDRPRSKRFAWLEDFFDENMKVRTKLALQRPGVIIGSGATVDMVDAQALDMAFAHQPEDQFVRPREDVRILDANATQGVDVEEAAVVDIAYGHAPMRQTIVLRIEQTVQSAKALRRSGDAVD